MLSARFIASLAAALFAALMAMTPAWGASTGTTGAALNLMNQAFGSFVDTLHSATAPLASNVVTAVSTPRVARLAFYTDSTYTHVANAEAIGESLRLQLDATACNLDSTKVETVNLTVWSDAVKTKRVLLATESAPNSGLFRTDVTATSENDATAASTVGRKTASEFDATDDVLAKTNDKLQATMEGCGLTLDATTLIDPSGVVFDSSTDQPVAGAQVTLIDVTGAGNGGNAGGQAVVFAMDGVTRAPSQLVTAADGKYVFALVAPSSYRLEVAPPVTYKFPSVKPLAQLPADRAFSSGGAFGAAFDVNAATGAVFVDLPVDVVPRALFVQKTASRTTVELAETLQYTVLVKNAGDIALNDVALTDTLPVGFAYVRGSARVEGTAVADPTGGVGPLLRFPIGVMSSQASVTMTYRVRVGPGALQGDGTNRAYASSTTPAVVTSNTAVAAVKVAAGVFTDKAMVLGTVYADCNNDGLQNDGEPGVPGVRLWMEDGTFVVTDGMGRYSLYGISPRTHILKVDATSLPVGAKMKVLAQRNGGDGNSRFVDPKRGELHRADFALDACTPEIMSAIKARRAGMNPELGLTSLLKRDLRADGTSQALGDVRSLPSSGLVADLPSNAATAPSSMPGSMFAAQTSASPASMSTAIAAAKATAVSADTSQQVLGSAPVSAPFGMAPAASETTSASTAAASASVPAAATPSLEQQLLALTPGDNKADVIFPKDFQVMRSALTSIRTKAPSSAVLSLEVNGEPVGDDRIGERARSDEAQTELREYVGVPLVAGDNVIGLIERDPFGNVRSRRLIHVVAPGELASVKIEVPAAPVEADGTSMVPVRITMVDAKGLTVAGRRPITLEASAGQWNVADLDLREPGIQTFVEDGVAELSLRAPGIPGDALLLVSTGSVSVKSKIAFVPALRPLIGAGIVEGTFNLRNLDPKALVPARHDDGFEEELRSFASSGGASAGARAAVFLKGKVKGDYLLTLGYDSDKASQTTLFRDIQPDEFYPVYGDSSVKGFDAQSTGRLYVRLDKNKSSLLYGDFTTQGSAAIQSSSLAGPASQQGFSTQSFTSASPVRQLGAYQRSLTGIKEHYESDDMSVNMFASRASSRQVIVELPANGTSGPFTLNGGTVLLNSEKVEIVVRDRNQPALVVSATPQIRFSDYDLEPLTGRLLFRAPIASLDANLNPISIRISFEVEQDGASFWVAGVDGQFRIGDRLEIGGSAVRDWNPLAPVALQSVNASVKLAERDVLTVEAAHIAHDGPSINPTTGDVTVGGAGKAERVEWQHDGKDLKARVYAGHSDVGFDNQSSSISSGRAEAGLKASYAIDEQTRLVAQGIHTAAVNTAARRDGILAGVERSFGGGVKLEVGARQVHDIPATIVPGTSEETDTTSVRAKLSAVVPGLPQVSLYGEVEQDVRDSDKRMVAIGGDYRIAQRGRLYARHEFISSLTGPYALDSTSRRNSTVVGVDSDYMKDGRVFSEYRGRDAFSGREAEAAIGLRNLWNIAEGVRVNTSLERVQPLTGAQAATVGTGAIADTTSTQSNAVTAALEYTRNPLWKGTARIEVRDATTVSSVLSTVGVAYKLNDDWTALAKNAIVSTDNKGVRANQLQERAQVGVAYRDTQNNKINGLARYEFKQERGVADDEGTRTVHTVSGHADYQASRELILTTEYAGKWVRETLDGIRGINSAHLLTGRATRDLGNNWDVGVAGRMLTDGHFAARQFGVGGEVGYMVQKNMWLSGGYNVVGFKDRDLSADNYTTKGVYIRIRFKFDETLLGGAAS